MKDRSDFIIRKANVTDIPFLITSIIEADKSGTEKSSYCSLLNITESEFNDLLKNIFELELEGFEFCTSSFCILEYKNELVGASASWLEYENGIPSWQSRMLSIREIAKPESFLHLLEMNKTAANLIPERSNYSLQIESVYIVPEFRGKGLFNLMLDFHLEKSQSQFQNLHSIELVVYDNNIAAIKAYSKLGFEVTKKTKLNNHTINCIFPSDGMILISKTI
jgi:ribosomal protein S18 acetylase RimI-like enzyme